MGIYSNNSILLDICIWAIYLRFHIIIYLRNHFSQRFFSTETGPVDINPICVQVYGVCGIGTYYADRNGSNGTWRAEIYYRR